MVKACAVMGHCRLQGTAQADRIWSMQCTLCTLAHAAAPPEPATANSSLATSGWHKSQVMSYKSATSRLRSVISCNIACTVTCNQAMRSCTEKLLRPTTAQGTDRGWYCSNAHVVRSSLRQVFLFDQPERTKHDFAAIGCPRLVLC